MANNRNTYILGSASNVGDSIICVYNKSIIKSKYNYIISIYNLTPFDNIKNSNDVETLFKTNEGIFKYNGLGKSGFDVIVYFDNVTGNITGYSEFSSIQGKETEVEIEVRIQNQFKEDENIKFTNSLSPAKTSSRNLIGVELNEYTSSLKVFSDLETIKKGRSGYTASLSEMVHNKRSHILLNSGILRDSEIMNLRVTQNNNIDSENKFTHTSFGCYNGDIVCYEWNDNNEYNVVSLTKLNKFGSSIIYTKSNTNTNKIEGVKNILYGAGKYFVCTDNNGNKCAYDFYSQYIIPTKTTGSNFIIDPLDETSRIYRFPTNVINYNILIEVVPEITCVYENLKEFLKGSIYPSLIYKYGNWYVFKSSIGKNNLYTALGIGFTLQMSEEDWNNCVFVNDSTVIIKDNVSDGYTYMQYSESDGPMQYTEKYKAIKNGSSTKEISINYRISDGISGNLSTSVNYNFATINNFDSNSDAFYCRLAPKNSSISQVFLNGLRKSSESIFLTSIPEFIGAVGGLIFYKEDNKLNYL